MILEELDGLIGHLRTECKCSVSFGEKDLTPDDYPHVSVVPVGDMQIPSGNETMNPVHMNVSLRVTASRTNERDALVVFERVVKAASTYHQSKGHKLADNGAAEYGENTYTISLPYSVKIII